MAVIPSIVNRAFEKLRQKTTDKIYLKLINGKYYVYRESGIWDKELKKTRIRSEYLGRILSNGTYIKKIASYKDELERAMVLITEKGGRVIWPEVGAVKAEQPASPIEMREDETDMKLIMALSMNARASLAQLGKLLGLSAAAVYNRIKHLEKKYGIRYLIDIDQTHFGFSRYIITAKFLDEMPDVTAIKNKLENNYYIQIAAITKGEFDLFIYVLTSSNKEIEDIVYKLRTSEPFVKFKANWNVTYIQILDGILPIRDEFFELLKEKVWHRTKETPRKHPEQIYYRIYATLRALNKDGRIKFSDIDREFGLKHGTARYTYVQDLVDSSLLLHKSVTISMQKLPIKYIAILQLEQIDMEKYKNNRRNWLIYNSRITESPTNKFILSCDIGSPYGLLRFLPVYHDGDLDCVEKEINEILKGGVKLKSTLIENIIIGNFAFNKIEKEHLRSYKILKRDYQNQDI